MLSMEDLCSDLYALMEERYSVRLNYLPPYREYRRLRSQTEDYDRVLREEAQE